MSLHVHLTIESQLIVICCFLYLAYLISSYKMSISELLRLGKVPMHFLLYPFMNIGNLFLNI